jgi:multiple sugar transport system substrate-binding protein
MLGGGLLEGFSTLVAGAAGVGKTTLALQFLCHGARQGERGTLISFEERPQKLAQLAAGYGLDLPALTESGLLEVWHFSPARLGPDELVCEIADRLRAHQPRRTAIDALTDLDFSYDDPRVVARIVQALKDLFDESGITSVLTTEIPELFGQSSITDKHISIVVDGIILLRYVELEGEVQRAASVLKMRGSDHEKAIRRFTIDATGMQVRSRFEGAEGLLGGAPRRVGVSLCAYSLSEVDERVTAAILKRFSLLHPHIQTVPLPLPYNPDEVYRVVTAALANRYRDLSVLPLCLYWMPEVLAAGELEPLDDLVPPGRQPEFLPELLSPGYYGGRLFGVPAIALCGVLAYRRDLLDKYGFAPPQTWAELVEQAKAILADEQRDDLYGYQFPGYRYESLASHFLECLWSNGGDVFDAAGQLALQGEPAVEAVRFLHDAIFTHGITPRNVVTLSHGMANHRDFVEGRCVFLSLMPNVLQEANAPDSPVRGCVGLAPPPVGPRGAASITYLGGWHYAIPRAASAPQAAQELIRFLTSEEVQREKVASGGPLPALEALYSDPDLVEQRPHLPELRALLRRSKHRHEIPNYLAISRILQAQLGSVLEGAAEPEAALAGAAADIERLRSNT